MWRHRDPRNNLNLLYLDPQPRSAAVYPGLVHSANLQDMPTVWGNPSGCSTSVRHGSQKKKYSLPGMYFAFILSRAAHVDLECLSSSEMHEIAVALSLLDVKLRMVPIFFLIKKKAALTSPRG